jgi:hypothetical protein
VAISPSFTRSPSRSTPPSRIPRGLGSARKAREAQEAQKTRVTRAAGVAVAAATGVLVQRARQRRTASSEDTTRWRTVTVALPEAELRPDGAWPEPLAAWGDAIEIRTRPAPGDRGTELSARLRADGKASAPEGLDGATDVEKLRSALRRAKQLLETGEVLSATSPPTTRPTVTNAPLRLATRRAGGVGRL